MAEFCWQCHLEHGFTGKGEDNDFFDPASKDHPDGPYRLMLCEGCGPIQVDWQGKCVSEDCMRNGHGGCK